MVSFLFSFFFNYLSRLATRLPSCLFFLHHRKIMLWYILASNKGLKRRFYTRRFAVFKIPGGKCRIHHPTDIFFIPIVKRKVPYTNIQFGLHCIYAYLSFRPWQLCHAENSTATGEGGGRGVEGVRGSWDGYQVPRSTKSMTILFSTYFIHSVPLSFHDTSLQAPFYSQFKHSFYGRFDTRWNILRKPGIRS